MAPGRVVLSLVVLALLGAPAGADELRFGARLGDRSGVSVSGAVSIGGGPALHHGAHARPGRKSHHRSHSKFRTGSRTGLRTGPGTGIGRLGIAPPPGAVQLRRRFDGLFGTTEPRRDWRGHHRHDRRGRHRHDRRGHHRHDRRGVVLGPFYRVDRDERAPEVVVVPPPRPAPPEPEPAPVRKPAPPPDPRGPLTVPVRGAAAGPVYSVGAPLPPDLPHVTLDWRRYGLPEPPAGLVYARVGRDVLLIDPVSRRVERRVEPATLEAAG